MYSAEIQDNRLLHLVREDNEDYFDVAVNGIIYLDHNLRIKNLNRQAEIICSVDRNKIIGKPAEVVFRSYGSKFLKLFKVNEYGEVYSTNISFYIKDRINHIHANALKLRTGVIIIMQDISAVRAAIKQIQTTQLLMSLAELAAGVAHHVRTPLTTISGYLQVMLNRLEDNQYTVRREVLEILLDEVSYINNVVKELVMFAKPQLNAHPGVNINRTLEEALLLTFKELNAERIEINKQLTPNLPTINADANLLKQALVNIMQNAIEAMPDSGVLTAKTWLHADHNMLVITIADTGCGVDPKILSRVFEPFYTTKLDRIGLGLPVAHRIVTEHGGFINITSAEPQGTKVNIYLPIINHRLRHLAVIHQQILNLQ